MENICALCGNGGRKSDAIDCSYIERDMHNETHCVQFEITIPCKKIADSLRIKINARIFGLSFKIGC